MSATEADFSEMDLSLDVATLLRRGTSAAHAIADDSKAAGWLTRGELDRCEYVRFLIILWHIYSTLEEALNEHATHPVLMPTYNPALLARSLALSSDIAHLLFVPESAWQLHPLAVSIAQVPPTPLTAYTQRISTIASSPDPSALLAHAYVRYLGDLSGGQVIRRRISKTYNLDADSGLGTQFYEFQKLGGGGVAGIGDMRRIKEWYREGMNLGVGDDEKRKAVLLEEANTAFKLNIDLLSILRPPSHPTSYPSTTVGPIESAKERTQPNVFVAGVISFILVMGIAHIVLVSGVFLGDSGLQKWGWARDWTERVFGIAIA